MIIVADSSPLVSLAILEKLGLLETLFDEIYIPQAVFDEITVSGKPFSHSLREFSKRKIKQVNNQVALSILIDDLDRGEAEAIVLAMENGVDDILIDEHKGRRIAKAKGLHPIGTIGILLQAKKEGLIRTVRPLLNELVESNIHISSRLYKEALNLAGEK